MRQSAVFIGTTAGPVQVLKITEEDPDVPSLMCVAGAARPLPVSTKYNNFVRRGSGVIATLTGHDSYCADLSGEITNGESWGLALFIAHALHSMGKLGGPGHPLKSAIWASGKVGRGLMTGSERALSISPIAFLGEKIEKSADLFRSLDEQGVSLKILLPEENLEAGLQNRIMELCPSAEIITLSRELDARTVWTQFSCEDAIDGSDDVKKKKQLLTVNRKGLVIAGVVATAFLISAIALLYRGGAASSSFVLADPSPVTDALNELVDVRVAIDYVVSPEQSCFNNPHRYRSMLDLAQPEATPNATRICGGGEIGILNRTSEQVSVALKLENPSADVSFHSAGADIVTAVIDKGETGILRWGRRQPRGSALYLEIQTTDSRRATIPIIRAAPQNE